MRQDKRIKKMEEEKNLNISYAFRMHKLSEKYALLKWNCRIK